MAPAALRTHKPKSRKPTKFTPPSVFSCHCSTRFPLRFRAHSQNLAFASPSPLSSSTTTLCAVMAIHMGRLSELGFALRCFRRSLGRPCFSLSSEDDDASPRFLFLRPSPCVNLVRTPARPQRRGRGGSVRVAHTRVAVALVWVGSVSRPTQARNEGSGTRPRPTTSHHSRRPNDAKESDECTHHGIRAFLHAPGHFDCRAHTHNQDYESLCIASWLVWFDPLTQPLFIRPLLPNIRPQARRSSTGLHQ